MTTADAFRKSLEPKVFLPLLFIWLLAAAALPSMAGNAPDDNLARGRDYFRQGQYTQALKFADMAMRVAATPGQTALAKGFTGLVHYQMYRYPQAETLLRDALAMGEGPAAERARWAATLAQLEFNRGQAGEARHLYAEALALANDDATLTTNIRLGQAHLLPPLPRLAELKAILASIASLGNAAEGSRFMVNIGSQASSLGQAGVKLAYEAYRQAEQLSEGQPRLAAEALSGLAQLYEDDQRQEEAQRLNDSAIQSARAANATELLLELEWRKGRLHKSLQETDAALAAYQRAVEHIEALRLDIPVEYPDGRSSFKETLQPIYLGLADLQLSQAKRQQGAPRMQLLQRARQSAESLKQSEMEDFLGGRCALAGSNRIVVDAVEARTALFYPLIFADRLEVLVSIAGEVRLYSQDVPAATVEAHARTFAKALRQGDPEAMALARQLYGWLIAAADPWLRERQVQTVVAVADGVLRMVPFAALHDGEHYLVERYAVANSPGLTILDPIPLQQAGGKALLVGLSQPGPVLDNLPPTFLQAESGGNSRDGTASEPDRTTEVSNQTNNTPRLMQQLSLPGVAEEIETLGRQMPNTALLDAQFTVNNFKNAATAEHYAIVHIASHGVLRDSADTSFIMAYDDVIHFNDLERLFKSDAFDDHPVQLLTLSACRTAEGDDRAPLGLSGIALKAKVRSAVGSLWPVADQATFRLMEVFYRQLAQAGTGKAEALRQAQRTLLADPRFSHPYFWAPFILVGNWL